MNTYIFMVEKRRPIYLTGQRYVLQNWQECHQTCPRCNVGEILAFIVTATAALFMILLRPWWKVPLHQPKNGIKQIYWNICNGPDFCPNILHFILYCVVWNKCKGWAQFKHILILEALFLLHGLPELFDLPLAAWSVNIKWMFY